MTVGDGRTEGGHDTCTHRPHGGNKAASFFLGWEGERTCVCRSTWTLQSDEKVKKKKRKRKCRREGERRVIINWAGELRWRQSSSRCQRGERVERGCAFWLFGVRERSDAEWGLARFCRESHCLGPLYSIVRTVYLTLRRQDGGFSN